MSLQRLITLGYVSATPAQFLATLQALRVDLLLDVRQLAMSRRKGFAKTALREGLAAAGIAYRHEPRLGSPKALRHRLRADADLGHFFREFGHHLDGERGLLETLAPQLHGTVAVLCFERDHTTCHRLTVAEALQALTGITPEHIVVQPESDVGRGVKTSIRKLQSRVRKRP